jgi:transcription initiation factor IIF auxiliary subunit
MKAIEINGEIKVYNELPNSWKGVMGNFSKLSEEEIQEYGFYDVEIPEYNSSIQKLTNLTFNESSKKFIYQVEDLTWDETLEELKENKINLLKSATKRYLADTDWYYIRKLQRDVDVPSEIETERNNFISRYNTKKEEINALTSKADVVNYELE